ncbi:MAG: aminomethyltransferase family protein [Geminicoccaceae bacterium]|nr:aminomethyltransferase family protein [Geminicoccaceae bacterium]
MPLSWRSSALVERHKALGSKLEDWSGLGTAWTYDKDIDDEHAAIRTKAGLMDVSGLNKIHLVGPHAEALIYEATTRDTTKIAPGRSTYAAMLDDDGHFIDDCIIYRLGPNSWMVVHGTGYGTQQLSRSVLGRNAAVLYDDDLHDLSLQGPLAVDFLEKHVPGIRDLRYFAHMQTRLFDAPVMISRTGYTGERGYEIFCKGAHAPTVWDRIVEEGADMGIIPCSFSVLDMLRVESYLLFFPFDNSQTYPFENGDPPGDSLWELGLDFTVSPGKSGFRGAEAHRRLKGKERFKIFGVLLEGDKAAKGGDEVYADGRKVGVVTEGLVSKLTGKSMAIARLDPSVAVQGTKLEVRGKNVQASGIAHTLPFDDPDKKKRTAVG